MLKITKIKKPKNSRYIPLDDPFTKKKGERANPTYELTQAVMKKLAQDMADNLMKSTALLKGLTDGRTTKK